MEIVQLNKLVDRCRAGTMNVIRSGLSMTTVVFEGHLCETVAARYCEGQLRKQ